ncbi:MAG: type II secretion system F family protein [Clostridiales Family XIII bacterium]|jgi:hypothetical protein|nr:type II secretion system F family protein [Clostridiales Family XIII bacterium]
MTKRALEKILSLMPQALTGAEAEMERKLKAAFGNRDFSGEIGAEKRKNAFNWLALAALALCLALAALAEAGRSDRPLENLGRPEAARGAERVAARVRASYGDGEAVRDVDIYVRPMALAAEEKLRRMESAMERLPVMILGENESLDDVASDLRLLTRDSETGVDITWRSDRPEVLDEGGALNPVTAAAGGEVALEARLTLEDLTETVELTATLGAPSPEKGVERGLEKLLEGELRRVNESREGGELALPSADEYGVAYLWEESRKNYYPALLLALALLGAALHRGRYGGVERRIKKAREGMARDFPEFVNKLLILLNAGMVVSTAIGRIVDDYEAGGGRKRELYEELAAIRRRMGQTNASFAAELNAFAARSSVRELMRFAAIVSDNLDKGSSLAGKLKQEGDLVWAARRKKAEEAGRLAETKMVMPMALILLVLIMITVAPAAMSM